MPIVPSGTRRIMQAQSFGDTINPQNDLGKLDLGQPTAGDQQITPQNTEQISMEPAKDVEDLKLDINKNEKSSDISSYIFEKLQSFGYPPRRLEEFESEFVKEKFYPGENKEVTIVIPDRYYGMKKGLSEEDVKVIIKEISEKFGLSFLEGDREDKKITLEFMSQQQAQQLAQDEEANTVVGDELDEVYGTPSNEKEKKGKSKKTKAYTAFELIKMGRDSWIEELMKRS